MYAITLIGLFSSLVFSEVITDTGERFLKKKVLEVISEDTND